MRLILTTLLFTSIQCFAQFNGDVVSQWETAFQEYGVDTQVKGMSIAIRSADALWTDQFGVSAASEPLTEDHLFAMGSVSKTITSATILQMYEEELLTLEDPLYMYLDTYENIDTTVTIRQLLNHTSGIYSYTSHPNLGLELLTNPTQIITPEEVVSEFVLEPDFPAGTDFSYSNTGYVLLGMIIDEIAGQTYYEEARERFDFDTNYPSLVIPPFETSPENLAHLWANFFGTGEMDMQASGYSLNLLFSGAGAAGAYAAKPKDLTQWARDLFTGTLLQPSTMTEMLTPSAFNDNYGLGVVFVNGFCSTELAGHTGGIIYTTATFYDSVNDIAISVHTNDGETTADMSFLAVQMFCIYNEFVSSVEELNGAESLQIYPNPFSDHITISYDLTKASHVDFTLLDQSGREVLKMDQSKKSAGLHQEELNVDLPVGLYILRLIVDDEITYRKVMKN